MTSATYIARRDRIETYFDRTASQAWARLTSDAPVSGIRATVRAGRDRMRAMLMDWLPQDLSGKRVLDAGCGTGALATLAAERGAHVVAVDLAGTLVGLARERSAGRHSGGVVEFHVGDMTDPTLGLFDHVVGMDSLIHYDARDMARVLAALAPRTSTSILFTFAPRTPLLATMHAVGRLFPRGDRAPSIVPVGPLALRRQIAVEPLLTGWQPARTQRVVSGFYLSQALELVRA